MLGVAGGELIIPAIILLCGIEIKLAGSMSLCVSIPTVLLGILKYRQNREFKIIKINKNFLISMTIGSVIGAFTGSRMLACVDVTALQIILGVILLISAVKIFGTENNVP